MAELKGRLFSGDEDIPKVVAITEVFAKNPTVKLQQSAND